MYVGMHACQVVVVIVLVVLVFDAVVVGDGGDDGGVVCADNVWSMCPLLASSCSFMFLDMSLCVRVICTCSCFSVSVCACLPVSLCGRLYAGKSARMYGLLVPVCVSKCLSNYLHV